MQSAGYEPHPRKITPLLMGKTPLKMKIFLPPATPPPPSPIPCPENKNCPTKTQATYLHRKHCQ